MVDRDEAAAALGEFIRAQRRLANISLRHLARASGVSDSYLSQVERGLYRPSADVVHAVARALKVPPTRLYTLLGLLEDEPSAEAAAGSGVEAAVRDDPRLSDAQKDALVQLYRTMVGA